MGQPVAPPAPPPPLAEPLPPPGSSPRIRSHGKRRRVPLWTVLLLVLGLGAVGAGLRFVPGSPLAPSSGTASGPPSTAAALAADPTASPTPEPEPLLFRSVPISTSLLKTKGFLSWALLDRRSGEVVGSSNMDKTSTTMSMIKAWLAADDLRLAADDGRNPSSSRLHSLEIMIRDSDNNVAETLYQQNGRANIIKRMISICGLKDSKPATNGRFGYTQVSARDAVLMGGCIAEGKAAGSKWTPWLLDMMRKVRGTGAFGIRYALPPVMRQTVAIKNGWDQWSEDRTYRTNCLAIGDTWVLSVLQRYPSTGNYGLDFAHTRKVCEETARKLLNPEAF